jgi:hypothetical protein
VDEFAVAFSQIVDYRRIVLWLLSLAFTPIAGGDHLTTCTLDRSQFDSMRRADHDPLPGEGAREFDSRCAVHLSRRYIHGLIFAVSGDLYRSGRKRIVPMVEEICPPSRHASSVSHFEQDRADRKCSAGYLEYPRCINFTRSPRTCGLARRTSSEYVIAQDHVGYRVATLHFFFLSLGSAPLHLRATWSLSPSFSTEKTRRRRSGPANQ